MWTVVDVDVWTVLMLMCGLCWMMMAKGGGIGGGGGGGGGGVGQWTVIAC